MDSADTKKPKLMGLIANSLLLKGSAVNVELRSSRINYILSCLVIQVGLFRASKKTSISGEPASPIADSIPRCERIKTDYNSCMYTWCRLIVLYYNNLYEFARLARGMVVSLKN